MIVGLGWRLARHEHSLARQQLHEFLLVRLRDTAQVLDDYFQQQERRLQALTEWVTFDPVSIRQLVRRDPLVNQIFVLSANGMLLHPDPTGPLNAAERLFFDDFGDLLLHNDLLSAAAGGDNPDVPRTGGWVARFRGPGLNLIYCQRVPSGHLVGVLLQRARWIADLIAALPDTDDALTADEHGSWDGRIRLADSNGLSVYEWGAFEPDEGAEPIQELSPSYPLSSWRLRHFVDEQAFATFGTGAYFNLISILAASGLVFLMAGIWFFREYNRRVREAIQRVSFVNQVSHELKTPLTNIRMYAELLENDLEEVQDDQSGAQRDHLKVIVEESQRLSRLIGNVLTFAQRQRNQVTLRLRPAVVDNVIASVLQRFEPAFGRRGLEVVFERSAGDQVDVDVDALEQMLGNLLNNVEKYASSGKRLEVTTRQENGFTTVLIRDDGPGIPARHRERIFRPFQRLSNHIADSPGTGIGLTIARQLAQLHGGDLRLVSSAEGACFEIRLHTPPRESEALG